MSWDSVPWFVGGGAQHSPEVARLLAYAATGGAEGVVAPTDLKVTALDVPAGAVRVLPGAGMVLNRAAGGGQQTYAARLPVADEVEIAATGSASGRSDLIVAQIEDPFMPGEPWQAPADPAVGPYVFTRVIPNVPAGTTRLQDAPGFEGRSALTLARVDLPPSTGTVTAAMITDLRGLVAPRTKRVLVNAAMPASAANLTSGTFVDWPTGGITVDVPSWAQKVDARVEALVGHIAPNVDVELRLMLHTTTIHTQRFAFDLPSGSVRVPLLVAGSVKIGPSAGQNRVVKLQGRRAAGTGYLTTRTDTSYVFDILFSEDVA